MSTILSLMVTPVKTPPPVRTKGKGRRKPYAWEERLAPVRRKPLQWFLLDGDWSQSVAGQIRRGTLKGIAKGEFQTKRRRTDNGRYHVYVRYVGDVPVPEDDPLDTGGWTLAKVTEAQLPRRWGTDGDLEVFLPADDFGGERWVSMSDLA